ncbi:CFE protein [Gossypium australe]|uniref:CFE protein n=1 Tax=Gossypium australe TaxID=47621 RepID=A0A5B6WAK1_9ROSI|nr:CFE protein [Gossypium australe]
MASVSTWMLSLKVLFISSGVLSIALGLKLSVPLVLEFSVSQAPLLWSTFRSWLKPPYLYFVINGIIITIAASSRFHQNNGENEKTEELMQQQPRSKILVEQQPDLEYEMKSSLDFDAVETVVYEQKEIVQEVEKTVFEEETNVAVVDDGDGGDVFAISKSEWIPPRRMDSSEIPLDVLFPVEKPPASSRFGHRKPVKANPEGGRALKVAKPKRHETLENTWKMITEGRAMPLTRHMKKSDTFENHGREINVEMMADSPLVKKSDTFRDRTNYQLQPSSSPASGKLRKEPSLSQDELNRRVEAFIKKFNEEMRLQRQESLNQYMEMVNRGC